eukprot:578777-Amphidinium_carterae.1
MQGCNLAASILFRLGGSVFSCGAMFDQVSNDCSRSAMHVTGHITGTDGARFQWHPFKQVGWGDDNVTRHTLLNTHDLISMYGKYCEQIVRDAYEDAELGLLRPRHILSQDMRVGIDEQIDLLRTVAQRLEIDAAYNMNSDTETIDDVGSITGASSMVVHDGGENSEGSVSGVGDFSPSLSEDNQGPMPSDDSAFGYSNQAAFGGSSRESSIGYAHHIEWEQWEDEDEHYDMTDRCNFIGDKKCVGYVHVHGADDSCFCS